MNWLAFYLFYHADRDRALLEFVQPAVRSLWLKEQIASFFFIRYALGGPHIRLRLLVNPGCESAVEEEVQLAAASFLARRPSTDSWDEATIRRINHTILANDAHEQEDAVYPDNFLRATPFRPEVDRYGGSGLLPHSLDLFAVSSVKALRYCNAYEHAARARRLSGACRLLARQLWSFADGDEALSVLQAFTASRKLDAILPHADSAYEARRSDFLSLLTTELEALGSPQAVPDLHDLASRQLAREASEADAEIRRRIGASQLHMTANRIGVTNAEEVYLGRLLERAAKDLATMKPAWWRSVADDRRRFLDSTRYSLTSLRRQILNDWLLPKSLSSPSPA